MEIYWLEKAHGQTCHKWNEMWQAIIILNFDGNVRQCRFIVTLDILVYTLPEVLSLL